MLPAAVVADPNVLLSAAIGGQALDVPRGPRAPRSWTTSEVLDEVTECPPSVGARRGPDANTRIEELQYLRVTEVPPETYRPFKQEARRRMAVCAEHLGSRAAWWQWAGISVML